MEQHINFITLGVRNLDAMKRFYTDVFGWTPLKDSDGIVFFQLNGLILALFPEDELAADAGIEPGASGFKRFTLAVNFRSELAVDQAFAALEKNGVSVIKRPEKVFWGGYSGYVADIEGNLWELAYNPFLVMDERGNSLTHS